MRKAHFLLSAAVAASLLSACSSDSTYESVDEMRNRLADKAGLVCDKTRHIPDASRLHESLAETLECRFGDGDWVGNFVRTQDSEGVELALNQIRTEESQGEDVDSVYYGDNWIVVLEYKKADAPASFREDWHKALGGTILEAPDFEE